MVIIRLSRGGAKKRPFYHLVATDSRKKRDSGNHLERLGHFNPIAAGGEVRLHINEERISYWKSVGAQTSDRVSRLLKEHHKSQGGTAAPVAAAAPKPKKKPAKKKAETTAE